MVVVVEMEVVGVMFVDGVRLCFDGWFIVES